MVNSEGNPTNRKQSIVKILLADDHYLVREGLKLLMAKAGSSLEFVEAVDFAGVHAQLAAHPMLDVAVLDLHMPGAGYQQELARVATDHPAVPLVVVSAFSTPSVVRQALAHASVYAFVAKNGSPGCMHTALQAALSRTHVGEVTDGAPAVASDADLLAPRLQAVRDLLRQGKSNKEIARQLGLSEGTVKNYMTSIFRTLKVANRTQAARADETLLP